MKKNLLLLMMLLGASSLCHARQNLSNGSSSVNSDDITVSDASVEKTLDEVVVSEDNQMSQVIDDEVAVRRPPLRITSSVSANLSEGLSILEVNYRLYAFTENAYLKINHVSEDVIDDSFTGGIHDFNPGNQLRIIDVTNGISGTESFNYSDWMPGKYKISLCQDGMETNSTYIDIVRLGSLNRVSASDNCVYISYEFGKTAKSAYVIVTDINGSLYVKKNLPLNSTQYNVNGNFRNYKYLEVMLYVNGNPVDSKTVMKR